MGGYSTGETGGGKAAAGGDVGAEPRKRVISSEVEDNFGWSSQVFGIDTGLV